ncbi:MAG: enoyl-CoA hydratase/isomerase family protein [Flavobacteriales bacterium]
MNYETIITDKNNGILKIRLNRPKKMNTLNLQMIDELNNALTEAEDDKEVKAIILTGEGEKAFVAGADISEFIEFSVEEGKNMSKNGHEKVFNKLENYPKPTIACINGFALGGGLELAMACHIRVASENAKMGLPEVSLGTIPGYGGTQRLPQLVGKGIAYEMIMTAGTISAEKAEKHGLVNYVCKPEEAMQQCEKIAGKTMNNSPTAISCAIESINTGVKDRDKGYNKEIEKFGETFGNDEFKEGTSAFIEKRKPEFH